MENNLNAKNKRTSIYLIVLTAFTLVVLIGATYAYYVNDITFGDDLPASINTAPTKLVFLSSTSGDLTYNTTPEQIGQYKINTAPIAAASASLNVDLTGTSTNEISYCYYDVIWQYDNTKDKYVESDVPLPHTTTLGTYPYEFSITINSVLNGRTANKKEKDLSVYPWDENGKTVLVKRMVIGSMDTVNKTTHSYTFATRMYNIDAEQTHLFNKQMSAYIKVDNQYCYTKTFEANTKHIMTLGSDGNYEEVDTVPADHVLDPDRTYCINGDANSVSFNSSTGDVSIPSGAECFVYFKSSSLPIYEFSNVDPYISGS